MKNSIAIKGITLSSALYLVGGIAILSGFILTILSMAEICTSACVEGHTYRLFRLKFEHIGLIFFTVATLLHVLAMKNPQIETLNGYLLLGGVGGELSFIYVQKYLMGSWCPLCLGIAATVATAAAAYGARGALKIKLRDYNKTKGTFMKHSTFSIITIVLGFTAAFMGVTKIDPLEAKEDSLKETIAFGSVKSPVEVYVFTDWFCPACNEVEPALKAMAPEIERKAKLFFIDADIHDESMNFTPYNLSFMMYNKPQYFDLRKALHELTEQTKTPTDAQIQSSVAPYGVTHKDLNYRDIDLATKMFSKLKQQFRINSTPTVVIINVDTKKGKRIAGKADINEANVLKAIDELSK